jgi:ABC-2 type transport system ATP-binding protein
VTATAAVETTRLTKYYGRQRGVVDLDLEVQAGEVFGFLGPNGAGKTTTIRLLLDLIRPSSGAATVLGRDTRRAGVELRRRVGYVPGELALYGHLTGAENLRFFGALRGGVDWTNVDELAGRLGCDLSRKVRDLSTGNKRKVALVQAFMHKPDLLILDEPTAGLDPLVQHEFYHLLQESRAAGQTIFLSSHMLPEVQRVCDRVAFVRAGSLLAIEDVAAVAGRAVHEVEIEFAGPPPTEALRSMPGVAGLVLDGERLRFGYSGSFDPLVKLAAGSTVLSLTSREPDLEDVFLAYYGDDLNGHGAVEPVAQGRGKGGR